MKVRVGDKRGELTVLRVVGNSITARCSCGKFKTMYASLFLRAAAPTCGTQCPTIRARRAAERASVHARLTAQYVGRRYSSLVITGVDPAATGRRHVKVTASCDCGGAGKFDLDEIVNSRRTSCGCRRLYVSPEWNLALYSKW